MFSTNHNKFKSWVKKSKYLCFSKCPPLFHQVTTCKQEGKKLLEIESQEENDIMSELLFHASKLNNVMDHVSTGQITCEGKTAASGLDWRGGVEHRPCKCLLLAQRN